MNLQLKLAVNLDLQLADGQIALSVLSLLSSFPFPPALKRYPIERKAIHHMYVFFCALTLDSCVLCCASRTCRRLLSVFCFFFFFQGTFSSRLFNARTSSSVSARWAMAASGSAPWTAWRSKINASSTLSVSLSFRALFQISLHRTHVMFKMIRYKGINGESSFEQSLLQRIPGCEVWGYDFSVKGVRVFFLKFPLVISSFLTDLLLT